MERLTSEALREWFREQGWAIEMDDRPGQAFDPFIRLTEHVIRVAREYAALASQSEEKGR